MGGKFKLEYDEKNKVLVGKITLSTVTKDDAKDIYTELEKSIPAYPDYESYILDASNAMEVTNDSLGYLMKSLAIVKKTAGYMLLILTEEILQKFMLSNPEMFDYYAVFFNYDEALKFILSKR
ncbi:MAG TPA: hypothetical protein PKX79_01515 [Spirochaetota bacterium]|jgi:hypothetical protein|nr:hypothetical protein [Spirochaetota bacterium]OQB00500.1 MAG: hypothetical protein BWY23_00064 [Spirochaetes bacterium ADurb.Bin218]HOK01062.1 hypothetical protein [Spirochaetota bacterium]HOK91462.1 hypothetical protein [Spirochaetota bacterium]HON14929.1 hypothetical protein [Spirochaetota bacterium]